MTPPPPVLTIENLTLGLPRLSDRRHAVENMSLSIMPGELLCVVGESGSGKSLTALAAIGLLPDGVEVLSGAVRLGATDLLSLSEAQWCAVRGRDVGTVFQEPMTSLNPVMRVGDQIAEAFRAHDLLSPAERYGRAIDLLSEVHLPHPDRMVRAYPHELSGGQRQRVMIAMAMALEPKLLIADEPTTALDVTTQAQVLKLIDSLRRRKGMAVLFITHDFGVVAEVADRVAVMQAGLLVEEGPVDEILYNPRHPYTRRLLAAVPSLTPPPAKPFSEEPVALRVEGLTKVFGSTGWFQKGRRVQAADAVSFEIRRGETLGLVGESGSGKSTVGRCVLRLIEPDGGRIEIGDVPFSEMSQRALRPQRRRIQMIFQDPFASLNPRRTVGEIVAEGPIIGGENESAALAQSRRILEQVGLPAAAAERYPHEFSGGQRQRIGIARALAVRPDVLVADEAVSALDVSVQADILALIRDLQVELGLAILFITHDLRVAAQLCDRVAVMQKGRIVETAATGQLFAHPKDAYTRRLLAAVPGAQRRA